jgi:3-oxoacyl-[acyl-carrier protein] reductase
MDTLTNRTALVTGANRGIGRAIAQALARAGAEVVINFRTHADEAETVAAECRAAGRRAITVQADVSRAEDVARLFQAIERDLPPVSILVNNAGIGRQIPLDQLTEADFDELYRVNLKSIFLVTQAALPAMRQARWGRIINLSSVAAQTGGVIGPHYAASKAGILGLTHAYASLLAREGITANAIAPALVETAMIEHLPPSARDRIPVGRFGTVDEVAAVAVMLAQTGYITGQTINVNGGWYMN